MANWACAFIPTLISNGNASFQRIVFCAVQSYCNEREGINVGMVNKTILIVAISLVVTAFVYNVVRWRYFKKHQHFQCPHCGYQFKPDTLKMILMGSLGSVGNDKIIKCPKCGEKACMKAQKDHEKSDSR
jgi:predicted RNA-binding Zn-ribbon protein involved in translation (DUF1610 family)